MDSIQRRRLVMVAVPTVVVLAVLGLFLFVGGSNGDDDSTAPGAVADPAGELAPGDADPSATTALLGAEAPDPKVNGGTGPGQAQTGATRPARGTTGGVLPLIAYASNGPGRSGIVVVRADGTGRKLITSDPGQYFAPVWSPDGTRLAYTAERGAHLSTFVTDLEGKSKRLGPESADTTNPTWSPDSARLAYSSRRDGNTDLYVGGADGSAERRITTADAEEYAPAWSPDGRAIAYVQDNGMGTRTVRLIGPDGEGDRTLAPTDATSPEWAPDGKSVAYVGRRGENTDVYVAAVSTGTGGSSGSSTGEQRLTTDPGEDFAPAWSPDGRRLAFTSRRDGNTDVYLAELGRPPADARRLTTSPGEELSPAWSADGAALVFVSDRDGNRQLYVLGLTGGPELRLTDGDIADYDPKWQPITQ